MRVEKCGIELSNRPRPTQGCRVNSRRRRGTENNTQNNKKTQNTENRKPK